MSLRSQHFLFHHNGVFKGKRRENVTPNVQKKKSDHFNKKQKLAPEPLFLALRMMQDASFSDLGTSRSVNFVEERLF